jgi:hypothetical protein
MKTGFFDKYMKLFKKWAEKRSQKRRADIDKENEDYFQRGYRLMGDDGSLSGTDYIKNGWKEPTAIFTFKKFFLMFFGLLLFLIILALILR